MRKAELKVNQAYLVDMDAEKDYGGNYFEFVLLDLDAESMDETVWRLNNGTQYRPFYNRVATNQEVAGMLRPMRIDNRKGEVTRYEDRQWRPAYVRTRRILSELDIEELKAQTEATSVRWANQRAEQARQARGQQDRAEQIVQQLTDWGFVEEDGTPTYYARDGEVRFQSEWGSKVPIEQAEQILKVLAEIEVT